MDDVERVFRYLVQTIRTSFPSYVVQPFAVGDLYQTILPYRLHRRELGLQSNEEYELVMLKLLSGAGGHLVVDDRMRDVLAAQLASPTPDLGVVRDFASAHVSLAPEVSPSGSAEATSARSTASAASVASPATAPFRAASASSEPSPRRVARPLAVPAKGEQCAFCKGDLPAGREIAFCPHCGQDLTLVRCPACGSELDRAWKFCVTCGRAAQET